MKILVVEDEPYVADLIQSALEQLGNNCVVADCADHADQLLDGTTVDAVTLDLGMPGRGGLEWLEAIATDRPDLARKTLVITGMHLEAALIERLAACGAGVLAKPFTVHGLHEAVRSQLDWIGKPPRGQDESDLV